MKAKDKYQVKGIGEDGFAIINRKTSEIIFRGKVTEVGAWLALYEEGFFN